ncbi:MAG: hypothetical protein M0009_17200 [Deltaproteobacteria bacterium]|nr:hypothetical protein [Deltaproteobacteria bacterium]
MKKKQCATIIRHAGLLMLTGLAVCLNEATAAVSPKAKATPAKAGTVAAEKYAVLNPRADRPAIEAKALAPRLTTLQGKTVYVYGSDFVMTSGLEVMLMVARGLAQTVPGVKVVYISDRYGDATADTVVPAIRIAKNRVDTDNWNTFKEAEKADAVVTGLGF